MKLSKDYTPHVLSVFLIFSVICFAYFVKHNNLNDSTRGSESNITIQVYGDEKMGYVVSKDDKMLWSDDASDTLKMKIAITK